jgi:hypothetical protein
MKNKILILYIPVNISHVYKCKIYKIGIIKKNTSNGIKKTRKRILILNTYIKT